MKVASFDRDIVFDANHPKVESMLDTASSKEIRICFKKSQSMKEHKTPFPITIHILEGLVEFGALDEITLLKKGDLIGLDGGIPHHLLAKEDSVVRLSLNKNDSTNRVSEVAKK